MLRPERPTTAATASVRKFVISYLHLLGLGVSEALITGGEVRRRTFREYRVYLIVHADFARDFPVFQRSGKVANDSEKRAVGRQIKHYLAVNRISREQFCFQTKLGKSTVDKLITGIYSENTLHIVLERTSFSRSANVAAKSLGGYAKSLWTGYISDYIIMRPDLNDDDAIVVGPVSIKWNDDLPGFCLYELDIHTGNWAIIGELAIPHERSPLIYVIPSGPIKAGAYLVVSIMMRTPVMRGLMLGIHNPAAHAYVPTAVPVALRRIENVSSIPKDEFGSLKPSHTKYTAYKKELRTVVDKKFAHMIFV
jgi:hypothetical protein